MNVESTHKEIVDRLRAQVAEAAQRVRPRISDARLPREWRAGARRLLADVFRALEEAPELASVVAVRTWVLAGREMRTALERLQAEIVAFDRPPRPFYAKGRLGVIRVMEPIRVRFVVSSGMLGRVEDFARHTMLVRLERRVAWLWDRLSQAHPQAFAQAEESRKGAAMRDENELVWGRTGR